MIKVKILKTGEVKEVKRNDAHTLIDKGLAKLYRPKEKMACPHCGKEYKSDYWFNKHVNNCSNKMMSSEGGKGYKTK